MPRKTSNPANLTDDQLEAIRVAVYLSGGAAKVAKAMGYRTGESVRRFTIGAKAVPAERVEDFRRATGNRLALTDIRPDLYKGLKAEALGYAPRAPKGQAASA